MFALVNGIWRGDYLDYHLGRASCRIRVLAMANIASVEDQYFVPRLSLRRVLSYVREFGIVPVLRKIRSRLRERARNAKYISCGVGVVLEDQNGGSLPLLSGPTLTTNASRLLISKTAP